MIEQYSMSLDKMMLDNVHTYELAAVIDLWCLLRIDEKEDL